MLSFKKAIQEEIICDYKIIFLEVTSQLVAKEMQLRINDKLQENAAYNAAMQIVLLKAIRKTGTMKIITFHARVMVSQDSKENKRINIKN